jgi:hypothetical protein
MHDCILTISDTGACRCVVPDLALRTMSASVCCRIKLRFSMRPPGCNFNLDKKAIIQ